MPTECNSVLFDFPPVEGRHVVAAFDGGKITSDAGALLLGGTDRVIRLTDRGLVATEIMPGIDAERDIVAASRGLVSVAEDARIMPRGLLAPEPMGLTL